MSTRSAVVFGAVVAGDGAHPSGRATPPPFQRSNLSSADQPHPASGVLGLIEGGYSGARDPGEHLIGLLQHGHVEAELSARSPPTSSPMYPAPTITSLRPGARSPRMRSTSAMFRRKCTPSRSEPGAVMWRGRPPVLKSRASYVQDGAVIQPNRPRHDGRGARRADRDGSAPDARHRKSAV